LSPGEATQNRNHQICYDRLADHRLERNPSSSRSAVAWLEIWLDLSQPPISAVSRSFGADDPAGASGQFVGGKVGESEGGKNLVGALLPSRLVLCDLGTREHCLNANIAPG
jgi:hypothetical protein